MYNSPQCDKAWDLYPYPCIGKYSFLDFSISSAPEYPSVPPRVKTGHRILDLACCFDQDIHKLVFDDAPSENICGSELEQGFIDMGYGLFRDRGKLAPKIISGDFSAPASAGLQEGSFNSIHAASFFHLSSWDEQIEGKL